MTNEQCRPVVPIPVAVAVVIKKKRRFDFFNLIERPDTIMILMIGLVGMFIAIGIIELGPSF